MTYPISVQLYSLREDSKNGFDGVLTRLADIGYAGVEPFNLFGMTPAAFRERVHGLGMQISSSHYPFANRVSVQETADVIGALGLKQAAGGFGPDDFKDRDAITRTADTVNRLLGDLGEHGIGLFLHNHYWEYELIDGKPAMHWLADLCPAVQFELDTYWASNFGARDVPAEVRHLGARAPLLHIKDGPLVKGQPNVAVGDGKLDARSIIAAADPNVLQWLIVELDACASDMFTAVERSFQWLTAQGLGHGRGNVRR